LAQLDKLKGEEKSQSTKVVVPDGAKTDVYLYGMGGERKGAIGQPKTSRGKPVTLA